MTAIGHILMSRFPDAITPGELPLKPESISIHANVFGGFILFRWYERGGEHLEQSPPEFYMTLADAWRGVPAEGFAPIPFPADFPALMVYYRTRESLAQ